MARARSIGRRLKLRVLLAWAASICVAEVIRSVFGICLAIGEFSYRDCVLRLVPATDP